MHPVLKFSLGTIGLLGWTGLAAAEEVKVVATIAPVHSLVSMVGDGVIKPALLLPPGASPHLHSMTPSQSAALAEADIVFVVGDGLELWLERPLTALAADAEIVELGVMPGVARLSVREAGAWNGHGDEHEHSHGGSGIDPHFWLSPDTSIIWLDAIAGVLAKSDPDHTAAYFTNAEQAAAGIGKLTASIDEMLKDVSDQPYIVFHDAYQYFEQRFDLHPAGAVQMDDAHKPGAARIKLLRDKIVELGIQCIFVEPQFSPDIAHTVAEETGAYIAILDPVGAELAPGPELYPQLLENLANALAGCLGQVRD